MSLQHVVSLHTLMLIGLVVPHLDVPHLVTVFSWDKISFLGHLNTKELSLIQVLKPNIDGL